MNDHFIHDPTDELEPVVCSCGKNSRGLYAPNVAFWLALEMVERDWHDDKKHMQVYEKKFIGWLTIQLNSGEVVQEKAHDHKLLERREEPDTPVERITHTRDLARRQRDAGLKAAGTDQRRADRSSIRGRRPEQLRGNR